MLLTSGVALVRPYASRATSAAAPRFDVLVYGGTMSGIMAAVAAAREGRNVALVRGPDALGGMPANGLSHADQQDPGVTGGLALDFYHRIGAYYGATYTFNYEPHVAFHVAVLLLSSYKVKVYLADMAEVRTSGLLTAMRLTDGTVVYADYIIDASYEGDLMAASGVTFRTGREAASQYGESVGGFGQGITDTEISATQPNGGAFWGVGPAPNLAVGAADNGVMAYNYRLCITSAGNRKPFPRPAGYDPSHYALAIHNFDRDTNAFKPSPLPNGKFDLNSSLAVTTDFIGGSVNYPNSSGSQRAQITASHFQYQAGLLYFLSNDPSVPSSIRGSVAAYGLAADEFTGNGGWPTQLYVREARRMVGRYVITENDVVDGATQPDSIGMAEFPFDCHVVNRYPSNHGTILLEGFFKPVLKFNARGYQIPYRALTPKMSDSKNLLVSVCASASHVAVTSLRVEQHYMIMGEAAGIAASLAFASRIPVQDVSTCELASKITRYGGRLKH